MGGVNRARGEMVPKACNELLAGFRPYSIRGFSTHLRASPPHSWGKVSVMSHLFLQILPWGPPCPAAIAGGGGSCNRRFGAAGHRWGWTAAVRRQQGAGTPCAAGDGTASRLLHHLSGPPACVVPCRGRRAELNGAGELSWEAGQHRRHQSITKNRSFQNIQLPPLCPK
jgi:hypothetical protein